MVIKYGQGFKAGLSLLITVKVTSENRERLGKRQIYVRLSKHLFL